MRNDRGVVQCFFATGVARTGATPFPADRVRLPAHGGQPLPPAVQRKMETVFGTGFADVRVHVGPEPAALGAQAFTYGSRIHFAPGRYDPASPAGQRLLGHELAHVVQQRTGRVRNPLASGVAIVNDRMLEAEADRMGLRAATAREPAIRQPVISQPATSQPAQCKLRPSQAGARVVQRMDASSSSAVVDPQQTRFKMLEQRLKAATTAMAQMAAAIERAGMAVDLDAVKKRVGSLYRGHAKAAEQASYSSASVNRFAAYVADMERTVLLLRVANCAAAAGDLQALARLRGVSTVMKAYVDNVALHQIDYHYYQDRISFGQVTSHLSGYTFAGLHGTSSTHASSLYGGLKVPSGAQVNYAVSQLGPGFYLTDGAAPPLHKAYADSVAKLSVKNAGGTPHLFRVMLRDRGSLTSTEVPKSAWNDMEHGTVNPGLASHSGTDLMTAPIVDNEPATQIKVNAGAFDRVMVMPPTDAGTSRTEMVKWIDARFDHRSK
ncbi:DUF4157 domain-containing protein [Arenibaculum sp.]|jgi:hypothetical protein|uniref:eCIS core domain-containing protein n=1 Tax=Arenibaculum sp. TaxID=2865862 RepID=UPI002E0E0B21|nr:DUF4157 domain-containing protein [Arenibaculum sp.]